LSERSSKVAVVQRKVDPKLGAERVGYNWAEAMGFAEITVSTFGTDDSYRVMDAGNMFAPVPRTD
jgi:predicted regulator of Ras-like GTPase activity (Roadblock/LC7/MglB family)